MNEQADDCMDAGVRATQEAKAELYVINEHCEFIFPRYPLEGGKQRIAPAEAFSER